MQLIRKCVRHRNDDPAVRFQISLEFLESSGLCSVPVVLVHFGPGCYLSCQGIEEIKIKKSP